MLGDAPGAQAIYREALAEFRQLGNKREEVRTLVSLAYALRGSEAEQTAREGLEAARVLGDAPLQARASHLLGDRAFQSGDFQEALARYQSAASLYESAGRDAELARVLTSLGRLHRAHGRAAEALTFYERGLAIQERLGEEFGAIQTLNAMAVAYGNLDRKDTALEYYERALARARRTGSPQVLTFLLANTANAYIDYGRPERGISMLREALATTPNSPNVAYWRLGLATALARQHQTGEALEHVLQGVELVRRAKNVEILPTALNTLAFVKRAAGDLEGALSAAREAIDGIEVLRAKLVPVDFMKRGFTDRSQEAFDQAVSVLQQLGRAGEAFELAERARARAFLDLLATREAHAAASNGGTAPGPAGTTAGGIDVLAAAREVMVRTEASAPPATLEDMARLASRLQSTVLAYWVSTDATIIWVITSDRLVKAARVEVSAAELARLVRQTWDISDTGVARRGGKGHASQTPMRIAAPPAGPWRRLHELLISPIAEFLPSSDGARLTIIPHRSLFRLSFAALQDRHRRYLVERYALHYASAGGAWAFAERRDAELRRGNETRLLLIADPAPLPRAAAAARETGLPELPQALREARAIARMFPRGSVTLLEGSQAGEPAVRAALRGKEVLHFATHAIVSDDQPLESFLALGSKPGADDSSSGDGRLTAAEIYGLKIDSRLVVLSACRTAAGKVSGDGILGLSRALFYAGTPAIVAAMWDVSDETTRVLMEHFYRAWPSRSRGDALRAAQLRLLRDIRAGRVRIQTAAGPAIVPNHPYYWAGFVLLGEF